MANLERRIEALEQHSGRQAKMEDWVVYNNAVEQGKDLTPWQGLKWDELAEYLKTLD